MTPPARSDDALQRALADVERLRADNAHLAELLSTARRLDRNGPWEHAQLQLALALSGIGLWRHDLHTGMLHHDERAQAMLGRNDGTRGLPLDSVRNTVHPDDAEDVQAALSMTLATGGPVDTQARYRHTDGRWRTLLTRRLLMRDGQGRPAMILGVALDVTEQQQRTTDALQLARRLEAAAEAARVGLWSGSLNDTRPEWNAQMYVLLTRDATQGTLGFGDALRVYTHEDDRDRVAATALPWMRGLGDQRLELEVRVRRGDGAIRWMQIRAQREGDADGTGRAFGVMLDVTNEREATERLRVANERTSLALSAVDMGTWSHDVASGLDDWDDRMFLLRGLTPGTPVPNREQRMALVLPEDRPLADTRAMPFASGANPLGYEFRIRRIDDGAVRTIASRSIALTDAQGHVVRRIGVNWDVTEARQVERVQREHELALRESRSKSALFARISHELRTPLNAVLGFTQLMQSEDARATPAERQHRLQQIETAGKRLLTLVDDVLDLSTRAQALGNDAHKSPPLADAQATAGTSSSRAPTLLYIEDNEVNMLIVREMLKQRPGVAFHGAADGASGVRLARELRPTLVLLDMQLPDMDGTAVLRLLRADPATASIPCIALSANAMPEDVQSARAAGFDDYWTKPIDLSAFLRTIDRLMTAG